MPAPKTLTDHLRDKSVYFALLAISVSVGVVPRCSDFQTVAAAEIEHTQLEEQIEHKHTECKERHTDIMEMLTTILEKL